MCPNTRLQSLFDEGTPACVCGPEDGADGYVLIPFKSHAHPPATAPYRATVMGRDPPRFSSPACAEYTLTASTQN
jgi:hypothetical protein